VSRDFYYNSDDGAMGSPCSRDYGMTPLIGKDCFSRLRRHLFGRFERNLLMRMRAAWNARSAPKFPSDYFFINCNLLIGPRAPIDNSRVLSRADCLSVPIDFRTERSYAVIRPRGASFLGAFVPSGRIIDEILIHSFIPFHFYILCRQHRT
jgi:hypothetical protein